MKKSALPHDHKEISKVCLYNRHLLCDVDDCTCTCHLDPVLINYFRELHRAKTKREVAMATTEKQTTYRPVSKMTLADLNKKHQQFHDGSSDAGSLQPKDVQFEPGTSVHNSRGLRGKVVRVQGSRVVVKLPGGGEDTWDLVKTYPASETADDSFATEKLREAVREFVAEENEEPAHEAGGAAKFGEAMEELLDEEEREPEIKGWGSQDEAPEKNPEPKGSGGLTNTSAYQNMRAELYMKQHPGVSKEEALKVVNSR